MDFVLEAPLALQSFFQFLGFEFYFGGTGLLGFLSYEALRVYKRGGISHAFTGIGWWYIPIFIVNSLLAAFVASVSAGGSVILAFWLGFSIPSGTGIFMVRTRQRPGKQSVSIDNVEMRAEATHPTFRDALDNYYGGAVW